MRYVMTVIIMYLKSVYCNYEIMIITIFIFVSIITFVIDASRSLLIIAHTRKIISISSIVRHNSSSNIYFISNVYRCLIAEYMHQSVEVPAAACWAVTARAAPHHGTQHDDGHRHTGPSGHMDTWNIPHCICYHSDISTS